MSSASDSHVYARDLKRQSRTSLSVIAARIPPQARVLDVGAGAGGLATLLRPQARRLVAITHNAQEAAACAPMYDRVELIDLEQPDWTRALESERFDAIVCADVLEHLRNPEAVLLALHDLLTPDGTLHISVPNVAYAGLIAALMRGEFRYGPEGLMDTTHLRFFTRSSITELLHQNRWQVTASDSIAQPLHETEYRFRLDELPPAVVRHLMAQPDASSYQLLVEAKPRPESESRDAGVSALDLYDTSHSAPTYVAELFAAGTDGFEPARRVTAFGVMGQDRQQLHFLIPAAFWPVKRLRLDPADRPGYWHLHQLVLRTVEGHVLWSWNASVDAVTSLHSAPRHQMEPYADNPLAVACSQPWLLTGDDPSIELPVEPARLENAGRADLELMVECSWPLSADYRAAIAALQNVPTPVPAQAPALKPAADPPPPLGAPDTWLRRVMRWLGGTQRADARTAQTATAVIVPVYGNLELVRACLASVVSSPSASLWQLIVIDDASPDAAVAGWMSEFARMHPQAIVMRNATNLGFVKTVNLGMTLAGGGDVVLLNSDTEVHGNWLDRLRAAAYRAPNIATVTPFSNNATICSFPQFCENNAMPEGLSLAQIDATFASVNAGRAVDIPTAVGFCMYIRRDCMDAIGLFDSETFGRGYGEENDFCMRALAQGWRHVHALDVFVKHGGGASFGDERHALQQHALAAIRRLYPAYEDRVRAFVQQDPAHAFRQAVATRLGMASGPSLATPPQVPDQDMPQ